MTGVQTCALPIWQESEEAGYGYQESTVPVQTGSRRRALAGSYEEDKELQAIFERTFGPVKSGRERNEEAYARVIETGPPQPS